MALRPRPRDAAALAAAARQPIRIVHVHIPKTAGSALSAAFQRTFGDRLRVYPERYEACFRQADYAGCNFFSGHIGFKVANAIGGDLITVLRDPIERFLSTYHFLRQMHASGAEISRKTTLAARYDIDQFAQISDEPVLEHELRNRMTWQIAYSDRPDLRQELAETGIGGQDLVRLAIANLGRFAAVGLQADLAGFAALLHHRYGLPFSVDHINVTSSRQSLRGLSSRSRGQIERWVDLDQLFYAGWLASRTPTRGSTPYRSTTE